MHAAAVRQTSVDQWLRPVDTASGLTRDAFDDCENDLVGNELPTRVFDLSVLFNIDSGPVPGP